jgi:hypothetical protein
MTKLTVAFGNFANAPKIFGMFLCVLRRLLSLMSNGVTILNCYRIMEDAHVEYRHGANRRACNKLEYTLRHSG